MKKRGQTGVESILVIAILILVFIFALSFTFLRNSDMITARAILDHQNACEKVASAINQVKVLGDGGEAIIFVRHNITVHSDSKPIISQDPKERAYCNFESVKTFNYTNLSGTLIIKNQKGVITITK
jgi:hypothetical protein